MAKAVSIGHSYPRSNTGIEVENHCENRLGKQVGFQIQFSINSYFYPNLLCYKGELKKNHYSNKKYICIK